MKEDKNTFKFLVVVAVIMAFVTIAGVSFAYFTSTIEESDVFTTKGRAKNDNLRISFSETKEGFTLANTYPMPDAMGLKMEPYVFTVTNEETDKTLIINVILEVLNASTLDDNLVNVSIGDKISTLNEAISMTPSESSFKSAYKVYSFEIAPGESITRELRTWINSNGTVDNAQNKTWSSRVLVVPALP